MGPRRWNHCSLVAGNHLTTIVSIGVKPDNMQKRQWMAKESRYTEHLSNLMGYWCPENLLPIPKVDTSRDHIEIAKSAGQDLALLKKMEPSLRGAQGAKVLHVEFGLRIQKLAAKTTVDFSALEVPGFEIDALEVEVAITGDEVRIAHSYLDKGLALMKGEVKRVGEVLVGKVCCLVLVSQRHSEWKELEGWNFLVTRA